MSESEFGGHTGSLPKCVNPAPRQSFTVLLITAVTQTNKGMVFSQVTEEWEPDPDTLASNPRRASPGKQAVWTAAQTQANKQKGLKDVSGT